jgi:hypothetical protein
MIHGVVKREVHYRYWCDACRSGGPGWDTSVDKAEAWRMMHERTDHHRDRSTHFLFHHLTR